MSTRGSIYCSDRIHIYHDIKDDRVHIELFGKYEFKMPVFLSRKIYGLPTYNLQKMVSKTINENRLAVRANITASNALYREMKKKEKSCQ